MFCGWDTWQHPNTNWALELHWTLPRSTSNLSSLVSAVLFSRAGFKNHSTIVAFFGFLRTLPCFSHVFARFLRVFLVLFSRFPCPGFYRVSPRVLLQETRDFRRGTGRSRLGVLGVQEERQDLVPLPGRHLLGLRLQFRHALRKCLFFSSFFGLNQRCLGNSCFFPPSWSAPLSTKPGRMRQGVICALRFRSLEMRVIFSCVEKCASFVNTFLFGLDQRALGKSFFV